jgi:NADH:ubiquinone oxidoreductase subunit D
MEDLIDHFKYFSEGFLVPAGTTYKSVESPKGEFGVLLTSDGSNKPYRCKVKPVSFYHLQALNSMLENSLFQDLVTIIGSQDLVLGEVDR